MSSLSFLATELQSLASEARRKHADVREAAEKSLATLRAHPELSAAALARDGPQSDEMLRPFLMGCQTRTPKVVGISLGSLQRLVLLRAVPPSLIPSIVQLMGESLSQGVDIQLKVLQALLSLLTNYRDVHDELLGDALLLCFRLQESRIAVVSSTAAATLRQLVMLVFDKVVDIDKNSTGSGSSDVSTTLPDGHVVQMSPSARDAFAVFEDLCLLVNSDKPRFLKLQSLPKTFGLELIESVLTNYHALFRNRREYLMVLQHHLCPMLLKSLSERPIFPMTLRSIRVVFLLLKQFSCDLPTEAEVFMMMLIRILSGENESGVADGVSRPQWVRVLCMEIMRGLCSDADLLRSIWDQFDGHPDASSRVFGGLISALKRLATEKPSVLGSGPQMTGVNVVVTASTQQGSAELAHGVAGYGLEVAGRVASVATATVSNVVGMMGADVGLSLTSSSPKVQCIDQLDKADAPAIPEGYLYLLALQCLISICEGFAAFTFPIYSSIEAQKLRGARDSALPASSSFNLSTLSDGHPSTIPLRTVGKMVDSAWPGLLSALSFYISTNLSDDLFGDTLSAFQNLANVAGILGLTTPRDAFLTSLARFAIPPGVVSSVDSFVEPTMPKTATVSDALGFSGIGMGHGGAPGLSERNLACLKSMISTAMYLRGSLGSTWFDILEVLQNADYVISLKGTRPIGSGKRGAPGSSFTPRSARSGSVIATPQPAISSPNPSQPPPSSRHPLLTDLELEDIQISVSKLFDATKGLDDPAFGAFIAALCKLSGEMVEMQASRAMQLQVRVSVDEAPSPSIIFVPMSPARSLASPLPSKSSRRISGMATTKPTRAGDYSIARLGDVSLVNIQRFVGSDPTVAWDPVTTHLLKVLGDSNAPPAIRRQAAEVLDEILVLVPRALLSSSALSADVQQRMFSVLARQALLDDTDPRTINVVLEIRRVALESLHTILQSAGHSLVTGWETIFEMLGGSCESPPLVNGQSSPGRLRSPSGLTIDTTRSSYAPSSKAANGLVRIAFQSLTLVCESLESLRPDQLRLCIKTLGQFGRQQDTNIALTAAESLLWSVSDSIQTKRSNAEQEPVYSSLWTSLMLELTGLCSDARHEVRYGAIQTLFRTLQLYGATLSLETWNECVWKVILPLVDSLAAAVRNASTDAMGLELEHSEKTAVMIDRPSPNLWDDSKTLTLQSISSVLRDFLVSKIMHLDTFIEAWDLFLKHIIDSVRQDAGTTTAAALRCFDQALRASSTISEDTSLWPVAQESWESAWMACESIGHCLEEESLTQDATHGVIRIHYYTQDSLLAFAEVLSALYAVTGPTWELSRLQRYLSISKTVLTYGRSNDYRPDVDSMTPVQTAILGTLAALSLEKSGAPSLYLSHLAEYSSLAFVAAFDYRPPPIPGLGTQKPPSIRRVTYVAVAKSAMPLLSQACTRFKAEGLIYQDGTMERVIASYVIPMKLKYDSPAPSKFGSDRPLWKTATSNFLTIVVEAVKIVERMKADIPAERVEGLWRQILEAYRGTLLSDGFPIDGLPSSSQAEDEDFDRAMLKCLQNELIHRLGDLRISDEVIIQFGQTLQIASRVHDLDLQRYTRVSYSKPGPTHPTIELELPQAGKADPHAQASERTFKPSKIHKHSGTTLESSMLPRERFSFWCLATLFSACSSVKTDHEISRRRVAALFLPALLGRCQSTLAHYVSDKRLRGNIPFPRAQEEELLCVLQEMLDLVLWTGTLWAALSDNPSHFSSKLPLVDATLPASSLIADILKRSSRAHLTHFYGLICEVAALPGRTSMWVEEDIKGGSLRELDSRHLATQALALIGQEIGL